MSGALLLGLLIVVLTFVYVVSPYLRGGGSSRRPAAAADPRAAMRLLRDELFATIVALDFDREVGKLDEDEYRLERNDLKRQAMAVLRLLDEVESVEERDSEVTRRASDPSVMRPAGRDAQEGVCASCGARVEAGDRFCAACGRPRSIPNEPFDSELDDSIERDVLALRRQRAARPAVVRVSGARRGRSR